ncbi:hypothetical protein ACFQ7B_36910 [Streptomyces erythrochromogenes]|uniref:hypothetical protein n=1 Tax=Streptomyces erythrochromogenes TaxID=285574 RepID=UPI00368CD521
MELTRLQGALKAGYLANRGLTLEALAGEVGCTPEQARPLLMSWAEANVRRTEGTEDSSLAHARKHAVHAFTHPRD